MNLVEGRRYYVTRREASEKSKQSRENEMIFLERLDELLLFRHSKGYKEAFLKKLEGIDFFISEA